MKNCNKCRKENNQDNKFCINCGAKFENKELNLDIVQKNNKNLKKLNTISAIINFIYAIFYSGLSIYTLLLVLDMFSYEYGGSGLILLALLIFFIFAIVFLGIGIFNIRINKKMNISSIETISIIEICIGIFLQFLNIPTLIISIIRMVLLSKIKKSNSN